MGVGDYVHSKEVGPHATDMGPSQRQLRATQSKVEVPAARLGDPQLNGRAVSLAFQEQRHIPDQQPHPPIENEGQRDMFDTDVEGVDDSTIAATSVHGFDDGRSHNPSINPYADFVPPPSYLPRPSNRSRPTWLEGYGDNAMKKAGFDTDPEDFSSQANSSVGADDEQTEEQAVEQDSWFMAHKNRSAEEPLSKRLENFWSARKRQSKPADQPQMMPQPKSAVDIAALEPQSQPRKLGHMLPPTAARKIALPPSMTAIPRTRFSPPKPSLLDQLDLSPPRYGSAPPSQTGRTISITAFHDHSDDDDDEDADNEETVRFGDRRASAKSFNTYDITNVTDDHGEAESQGPFISHSTSASISTQRDRRDTVIKSKKRSFEADYSLGQIYQKSFAELQAEPFEKAPTRATTPIKSPTLSPQPSLNIPVLSPNNTASHIMSIDEKDRQEYFSRMSVDEWEDCGDQFIDQFSKLLLEMKKLRRARRHTAAMFESEIRRRHELAEKQNSDLSQKLDEMRTGGAEVLRGRKP